MSLLKLAKYYQYKLSTNLYYPSKEEDNLYQANIYATQLLSECKKHPGIQDPDASDILPKCVKLIQDISELRNNFRNLGRNEIYNQARLLWNAAGVIDQRCLEDLTNSKNCQELATHVYDIIYDSFRNWQPAMTKKRNQK